MAEDSDLDAQPETSAPADPSSASCGPRTCQNGGNCVDGGCVCSGDFRGETCGLKICNNNYEIRTADDLAVYQPCAEIRGRLSIAPVGVDEDIVLPNLTKIDGRLVITGQSNNAGVTAPRLESLTLPKLTAIGALDVHDTGTGTVLTLDFPALETIGSTASVVGLYVYNTDTQALRLPSLQAIYGDLVLSRLPKLCQLEVRPGLVFTGSATLHDLYNIPLSSRKWLLDQAPQGASELNVGCCQIGDSSASCAFGFDEYRELCICPPQSE